MKVVLLCRVSTQSQDYTRQVNELTDYCKAMGWEICKIFKNITGETFHNVLNSHRIKNACTLLKSTDFSIEEIATRVGFNGSKSFCRIFKDIKGVSPGSYRKNK